MKAIILGLNLLFVSSLVACSSTEPVTLKKKVTEVNYQAAGDSAPRRRLMILPFLDEGGTRSPELRSRARDEVIRELNKTGEVIVVDSKDLKVDWEKMTAGSEYKMDEISKAAHLLGVNAIMEGKLVQLKIGKQADPVGLFRQLRTKFEAKARVRIFAARTGRTLFDTEKVVTLEESNYRVGERPDADQIFAHNPELVEKLVSDTFLDFTGQILASVSKINWEGRVALVNGDRIFLNVGKISGLQVGDLLKVTETGDEIYDPNSGYFIGKVPGRLKGTLEVVSYFGHDGAIAIVHSGSGFRENDRVELYY